MPPKRFYDGVDILSKDFVLHILEYVVAICCGWDVSPDDMSKTEYVRNSRNRLQSKIFIYSQYDVICTVCPWEMLVGN